MLADRSDRAPATAAGTRGRRECSLTPSSSLRPCAPAAPEPLPAPARGAPTALMAPPGALNAFHPFISGGVARGADRGSGALHAASERHLVHDLRGGVAVAREAAGMSTSYPSRRTSPPRSSGAPWPARVSPDRNHITSASRSRVIA
jgi:hypothetical protein